MDNITNTEIWKDVEGYEGLYKISSCGRVWSVKRNHEKKAGLTKGYLQVTLSKNNEKNRLSVHRLTALAFINNPENKPEVNHLDENKLNNHISNLQWVTSKENANWGTRNERISEYVKANPVNLTKSKGIKQIDPNSGEVIRVYRSVTEASEINGFHQGNISSCCAGRIFTSRGYKWEYIN